MIDPYLRSVLTCYIKYIKDGYIFYINKDIWDHSKKHLKKSFLLLRKVSDYCFPITVINDIKDREYGSLEARIDSSVCIIKTIKDGEDID